MMVPSKELQNLKGFNELKDSLATQITEIRDKIVSECNSEEIVFYRGMLTALENILGGFGFETETKTVIRQVSLSEKLS